MKNVLDIAGPPSRHPINLAAPDVIALVEVDGMARYFAADNLGRYAVGAIPETCLAASVALSRDLASLWSSGLRLPAGGSWVPEVGPATLASGGGAVAGRSRTGPPS